MMIYHDLINFKTNELLKLQLAHIRFFYLRNQQVDYQ